MDTASLIGTWVEWENRRSKDLINFESLGLVNSQISIAIHGIFNL
jgi:uncharacterized Tic20 family protein